MVVKINKIIEKYDVFLLDIFGLIHDGGELYEGVIDLFLEIKKANKRAFFLSNAPRGSDLTAKKLASFGINNDFYEKIFTPGQMFFDKCINGEFFGKFFAFGKEEDVKSIDKINGMKRVFDVNDADFIISFGVFENEFENDKVNEYLQIAKNRNLKMICVNPDIIVKQKKDFNLQILCAGFIAKEFEKIDGKVDYFGKPYLSIYNEVFKYLGEDFDKSKIIALGDSLETDILGANRANIASGLVLTGIHSDLVKNGNFDIEKFNIIKNEIKSIPDYVLFDLNV